MRLLNVCILEFRDFNITSPYVLPPYVIASHRWSSDETTYKRFLAEFVTMPGRKKVQNFCRLVEGMNFKVIDSPALAELGFVVKTDWLWVDTACIDKTDSVEFSESINSMFRWYCDAAVCCAFLHDVRTMRDYQDAMLDFIQSEWFTRGWTLQELLAPKVVVFLTKDWEVLGHKCSYAKSICDLVCRGFGQRLDFILSIITKIPLDIIREYISADVRDVNEKLSWIGGRTKTRPEDMAYCLLGICGVCMSPIYGEGENAWRRLQNLIRAKQSQALYVENGPGHDEAHESLFSLRPYSTRPDMQHSTYSEVRSGIDVLWEAKKNTLLAASRARTNAVLRHSRGLTVESTRAIPLKAFNMICIAIEHATLTPIEPKLLSKWLLQDAETILCAYCHGIIGENHPKLSCPVSTCHAVFHLRCAGQRCEKCTDAAAADRGDSSSPTLSPRLEELRDDDQRALSSADRRSSTLLMPPSNQSVSIQQRRSEPCHLRGRKRLWNQHFWRAQGHRTIQRENAQAKIAEQTSTDHDETAACQNTRQLGYNKRDQRVHD